MQVGEPIDPVFWTLKAISWALEEEHDLDLRLAYQSSIDELPHTAMVMQRARFGVDHEVTNGSVTLKSKRKGFRFVFKSWYTWWSYDDVPKGDYKLTFIWERPGDAHEDLLAEQSLEED